MSGDTQLYLYWLILLTVMSSMSSRLIASYIRIPSLCLHVPLFLCSIIYISLTWFHILAVVHTDAMNSDAQMFQRFGVQLFGIRSESQKWSCLNHTVILLLFCEARVISFPLQMNHFIFLPAASALRIFCPLIRNSHHNIIRHKWCAPLVGFHFPNNSR